MATAQQQEVATATSMEIPNFDDWSSDLSEPNSPLSPPTLAFEISNGSSYPSPPSSQQSTTASPAPEPASVASQDGGPPPAKRRKISPKMPRKTRNLNLHDPTDEEKTSQQADLDLLIKALRNKRKIVVIAGAGISVSAGIPDFRSSTGLFKSLKSQHKLKGSGKHLFDASVYRDAATTTSFHHMVRSLSTMTKSAKPTDFHHLLARLAQEGRLLRLYSQNVDGIDTSLEPLATETPLPRKGPWPKTIQLHGGLEKMMCTKCNALSDFDANLFDGPTPPQCNVCLETDQVRTEVAGKRSHGVGMLRPRLVLYNEHNPDDEAIGSVTKADMRTRPDAVIVVGTSLKVPGVRRIVKEMCGIVRGRRDGLTVWINRDSVPTGNFFEDSWDLIVNGTSDTVAGLANLGKWDEYEMSIGEFNEVTQDTVDEVKEKSDPHVVVQSPPKKTPLKNIEAMPTPLASPRPLFNPPLDGFTIPAAAAAPVKAEERPPNEEKAQPEETILVKATSQPEATTQPKTANPASQGKTLTELLGNASLDSTKAVKKPAAKTLGTTKAVTTRTTTKVGPKRAKKSSAKVMGKSSWAETEAESTTKEKITLRLNLKTTKPTATASSEETKEFSKPVEAISKSQPSTPRKKQTTLNSVSPNRSPARFPGFMAKAAAQNAEQLQKS